MPTSTQLASMAARTKPLNGSEAPPPAPIAPDATNASLPIMGPVSSPRPIVFAPAPASALSPAQRAAQTRAQNSAGIRPAKAEKAAPAPTARPLGLDLVMRIGPVTGGLSVGFAFMQGATAADGAAIPADEAGLADISVIALANPGGELEPPTGVRFTATEATADQLGRALPLMRRLNGAILNAYDDTEDASFPQMVLTLAGALRVSHIEVAQPGGEPPIQAKRGAAYISAFKAWEAHKPR